MIVSDLFESPQQCPECGGPAFGDLLLAEKKDACYHKVRSRYKVWPSAYASGALVQCRKKGAANWGNKSTEESMCEGGDAFMPGIQNTPEYKQGFTTGKLPVPYPEGTQEYASYYKGVIDKASPTLAKQGVEEELTMKHQRDHQTQKYADTSNSLTKRSLGQAEVPNVPKSADGHPTVKYRSDGKAAYTRVDPTITPTTVKRKDSDRPIPSFLKKDVTEAQSEPEQQQMDANRRAALRREREPEGSDKIDARLAQQHAQRQEYERTGNFWLKTKTTQKHIQGPIVGKAAANKAALELLQQAPELRGNLVITAYGPGETQDMAEAQPEKIGGRYDPDQFDDMVKRVKKLAGSGPMKTVWDPVRKIYRNVPVQKPNDK